MIPITWFLANVIFQKKIPIMLSEGLLYYLYNGSIQTSQKSSSFENQKQNSIFPWNQSFSAHSRAPTDGQTENDNNVKYTNTVDVLFGQVSTFLKDSTTFIYGLGSL